MSLVDNTVTNIGAYEHVIIKLICAYEHVIIKLICAYEHVIIKLALVPEQTDSNAT